MQKYLYCLVMKGCAMNFERVRTEDSRRYCVHVAPVSGGYVGTFTDLKLRKFVI
jgi:hypothetical protein